MAIRGNALNDYLTRTADLPSGSAYSITGWCNAAGLTASTYHFISTFEQSALRFGAIGWRDTNPCTMCVIGDAGGEVDFTTNYTTATGWFFFALTVGATAVIGYTARPTDAACQTATTSTVGITPVAMRLLQSTDSYWVDGDVANVKVWSGTVLSAAQIQQERWSVVPTNATNLYLWSPLMVNTSDYSGNGRNWTESGSLTYEDGPPVWWGAHPPYTVGSAGSIPVVLIPHDPGMWFDVR